MRSIIGVCILAVVLSGCATGNRADLTPRDKLRQKMGLIKDVRRRLPTATCKEIDEAMAYSFLLFRTLSDKRVVKTANDKARGASLILRSVYFDFQSEYEERCDAVALRTRAMQKLYPDIMREVRRRRAERAPVSQQQN